MKNIIFFAFALFVLNACQQSNRIGYVDTGEVVNNYQWKKDLEAEYQSRADNFSKQADSIEKVFKMKIQEELAKVKSKNEAELIQHSYKQSMGKLNQQSQQGIQGLQQEFQVKVDSVINKIKAFVSDYGTKNGYTYILGTSDAAPIILHASKKDDLTAIIRDALNAEYQKK